MAKKGPTERGKKDLDRIQRGAKREKQKADGALDGRYRVKVVPNKKRTRRPWRKDVEEDP
ncbi:MAG: hypothetical protein R2815_13115 [Flavobacteriales bacterium]|nr:hypothetical protein [Flavobacteriales bacterium]